ncbi:MAG: uracil-DNA glycosylase [Proteobacteria bacterium]|nr:uracil-DNA glycosylase [Pseudomonadota bacterium]
MAPPTTPGPDCPLCPRLVEFRASNRRRHPHWHNGPVPSFAPRGGGDVGLLVVGLAPGLRGANCSGRPFTGDAAGDLLYPVMLDFGLAEGRYGRTSDDGFRLRRARVTNAVRCVPPENRPRGAEVAACRPFLAAEIGSLPGLKVILALGTVAHGAVVAALGLKKSHWPFRHGALHALPAAPVLADSYHCSRYNTNTGRLTPAMFRAVFENIAPLLDG